MEGGVVMQCSECGHVLNPHTVPSGSYKLVNVTVVYNTCDKCHKKFDQFGKPVEAHEIQEVENKVNNFLESLWKHGTKEST